MKDYASHQNYLRLGNDAFIAKNFKEAIDHYTNALKLDPNNAVYYANRRYEIEHLLK